MEHFLSKELIWTRKPQQAAVTRETVEIVTEPHTDLWQRTYYGFQNDNAPVLQIRTKEPYFSFTVRTEFHSKRRFLGAWRPLERVQKGRGLPPAQFQWIAWSKT